jgi:hypothetical protein
MYKPLIQLLLPRHLMGSQKNIGSEQVHVAIETKYITQKQQTVQRIDGIVAQYELNV